jgi:uncharacterized protein (DUF2141 family)
MKLFTFRTVKRSAMALSLSLAAGQVAWAQDAAPPAPATLVLSFTGLKSEEGAVYAAVFDAEAKYDAGADPVRQVKIPIKDGGAVAALTDLPTGRYAVKAFHDRTEAGVLRFNMFGIPTEPVAFSNNAKVNMKAPSWAQTAFDLGPGETTQTITID